MCISIVNVNFPLHSIETLSVSLVCSVCIVSAPLSLNECTLVVQIRVCVCDSGDYVLGTCLRAYGSVELCLCFMCV